jgi:hypothetical protein
LICSDLIGLYVPLKKKIIALYVIPLLLLLLFQIYFLLPNLQLQSLKRLLPHMQIAYNNCNSNVDADTCTNT